MSRDRLSQSSGADTTIDIAIIGAGFAGLYMLHKVQELGLEARIFEKAEGIGGTWYWNCYPGAACDSESYIYCYSFSEELLEDWTWSERYPMQPEVLKYLQHVADRFGLREDIQLNTEVTSANFDEQAEEWKLLLDGDSRVSADFLVTGVGCLSSPSVPEFDGIKEYRGDIHHTARWPKNGADLKNQKVGVIGTGSSGIQVSTAIADRVKHLTVFQRTPNYAIPAGNHLLDQSDMAEIREQYDNIWEKAHKSSFGRPLETEYETAEDLSMSEVREILEPRWQKGGFQFELAFDDLLTNPETNQKVAQFIRSKIREAVDDPEIGEKLTPRDHPFGAKRPPFQEGYYAMFNEDHIELADVRESPIQRFTKSGIQTTGGHYDLDTVIMATGFDAITGELLNIDIVGRDGLSLQKKWEGGPETYLGVAVSGFPNLFTITGPQSPSVLSNIPVSIEQHVEWISGIIEYAINHQHSYVEPTPEAERYWVSHCNAVADQFLYSEAESWYFEENDDDSRVFAAYAGGVGTYRDILTDVAQTDYDGFVFTDSSGELDESSGDCTIATIENGV